MAIPRLLILGAAALVAPMGVANAGPCSPEIDRTQARIDAKLEAMAARGSFARESPAARLHRQPTPGSIAEAEIRLHEESARTVETIRSAMARAREADQAGDRSACEAAVAEVQRLIGP